MGTQHERFKGLGKAIENLGRSVHRVGSDIEGRHRAIHEVLIDVGSGDRDYKITELNLFRDGVLAASHQVAKTEFTRNGVGMYGHDKAVPVVDILDEHNVDIPILRKAINAEIDPAWVQDTLLTTAMGAELVGAHAGVLVAARHFACSAYDVPYLVGGRYGLSEIKSQIGYTLTPVSA